MSYISRGRKKESTDFWLELRQGCRKQFERGGAQNAGRKNFGLPLYFFTVLPPSLPPPVERELQKIGWSRPTEEFPSQVWLWLIYTKSYYNLTETIIILQFLFKLSSKMWWRVFIWYIVCSGWIIIAFWCPACSPVVCLTTLRSKLPCSHTWRTGG